MTKCASREQPPPLSAVYSQIESFNRELRCLFHMTYLSLYPHSRSGRAPSFIKSNKPSFGSFGADLGIGRAPYGRAAAIPHAHVAYTCSELLDALPACLPLTPSLPPSLSPSLPGPPRCQIPFFVHSVRRGRNRCRRLVACYLTRVASVDRSLDRSEWSSDSSLQ